MCKQELTHSLQRKSAFWSDKTFSFVNVNHVLTREGFLIYFVFHCKDDTVFFKIGKICDLSGFNIFKTATKSVQMHDKIVLHLSWPNEPAKYTVKYVYVYGSSLAVISYGFEPISTHGKGWGEAYQGVW